ncbi:MAG TPA: DUF2141 domain-containing protein [Bacteroidia bacterium]|nr:DUF2141 domain-containing protein [Bacteroidia bacterium]
MLLIPLIISSFLSLFAQPPMTPNVEIMVTNIRNNKGQIAIGIYKDQHSFDKEQSLVNKKFEKKAMQKGILLIKFDIEPGTYGFTLLDDENANSKMEYNFFGLPTEGFGFSNYYHTGFTRPKFESFKLEVKQNELNKSTIKVRYL